MNGRIIEGLGDKPITIKYAKNEQRTQANPFVQSFNRNSVWMNKFEIKNIIFTNSYKFICCNW